jgi:hypothetical protein
LCQVFNHCSELQTIHLESMSGLKDGFVAPLQQLLHLSSVEV